MAGTAVVEAAGAHLNGDLTGFRRRSGCTVGWINLRFYLKRCVYQPVVDDDFRRRGSAHRCKSFRIGLNLGSAANYSDPVLYWIIGIHCRNPSSNSYLLGFGDLVAVVGEGYEKLL